jgi:hypothetical protein
MPLNINLFPSHKLNYNDHSIKTFAQHYNQTEATNQTNSTSVQAENSQTLAAEDMQAVRGRVIKIGLGAAVMAFIKWIANTAVSKAKGIAAKDGVTRVTIRAARRRAIGWARRHLIHLGAAGLGALEGLTTYLWNTHPRRWCGWRAAGSMIKSAAFAVGFVMLGARAVR